MTIGSRLIIIGGAAALGWLVGCGSGTPRPVVTGANATNGAEGATPGAPAARAHADGARSVAGRPDPSLLPRKLLFGNPDHRTPKVSPSGRHLAWLAPRDGVMNVYVAPRDDLASARAVTVEKNRPIPEFDWAYDSRHILYSLDEDGDEDVHVFSADIETSARTDLTPFDKTRGLILKLSARVPGAVLLGMNDRDAQFHDAYRVDLSSGRRELVLKNEAHADLVADAALAVRFALKPAAGGGFELERWDAKRGFEPYQSVPADDAVTTAPLRFDERGSVLYFADSRGRDTSALVALDTTTKQTTLLADDARADIGALVVSPIDGHAQAVSFEYDRRSWRVLDPSIAPDFEYLKTVVDGDFDILSRSQKDDFWTVEYVVSDGPVRFYLYDRAKRTATFLFTNRAALEGAKLAEMHPVVIPARDGKPLVSYLSLPPGAGPAGATRPSRPLPMVLEVHGGPWARDSWGYDPWHQWLATRGYAVLSVNYRGSTGFGKAFVNAADREWGGKMHDDLIDAVEWAKKSGIAEPERIAILGGSYGGYATLVGLTFTPDVFACGVDLVGISNLNTFLASIPPYWEPYLEYLARRVGDPRTDAGRALLTERSPLTRAGSIARPLLIAQGANDPRVKQAESDQIVSTMKAKRLPVSYVLFPDEGHGFARPENRLAFFAVAEAFLAQHLGGSYQPIGEDFVGSSITVPEGAAQIAGVSEALGQR
jgi:dipeptidyl aminopeptidase/acylaminoacyl peptidase